MYFFWRRLSCQYAQTLRRSFKLQLQVEVGCRSAAYRYSCQSHVSCVRDNNCRNRWSWREVDHHYHFSEVGQVQACLGRANCRSWSEPTRTNYLAPSISSRPDPSQTCSILLGSTLLSLVSRPAIFSLNFPQDIS